MCCVISFYYPLQRFLREDLKNYGIKFDQCPVYTGETRTPTSVIAINSQNGSRTIMHTAKYEILFTSLKETCGAFFMF